MKAGKIVVAVVMVVLVLGVGGGVLWYLSVPHTAKDQLAYAQKLEKVLRGDALTKGPGQLAPQIDKTVGAYDAVRMNYGKVAEAAEGLKRGAKVLEEVAKDDGKAMGKLEELIKDFAGVEDAGFGLREEARLLRKQGDELKIGKPAEAVKKYKEAIGKLEEYQKRFEKDSKGKPDSALMEIGRIWQDGIGEPLIRTIETFEKLLKDYPGSEERPEAMFRLAEAYRQAKEFEAAIRWYTQLLEEYPKCEWADRALFAKGQILADKMEKHDEAAKEFEKLQEEHPESPLREQASGRAREEEGKAGEQESENYGKSRYGGAIPFDTTRDKPMPPAGMFEKFAEQKLDAQKYDLDVRFVPAENRLTVMGTLKVGNDGADKKEMLLMLGGPLNVTALTVDGKAAKFTHSGETLDITLPEELKKGAVATVGFSYTGQYAAPMPEMEDLKEAMGGGEKGRGEGTTAPATGPASAPAEKIKKAMAHPYEMQMGLGEFGFGLSGAMWYPVTLLGDVFDAHVVIHVPANLEAVSNGEIVKREKSTKEGVDGLFEFETREPVFGLYFAYGPYTVQESQVGPIHFYSYFRPENAGKHQAYVEVTNRILSFYASKFAPFPYEKMAIVEVPLPPMLGGVGPASLMFLHQRMVAHAGVPENLLAHELAHQWFGNLVPIAVMTEGYNQWLSEGFATYCDALYTEHTDGEKALAAHMEKYGQLFFQFYMMARRGEGAIKTTYPSSGLYRPVIYEKGAIVLHMLRKVMGDEKFFKLMREYVETYKNKPTTMDDFRRLADKVNGEDLSWFFSEWIDQTVFAHWRLNVEMSGGEKAGEAVKVKIMISQPDDLVKMPADITLIGAAGERQVVANVMLDKKEQTVEATSTFKPVKVIVDEDFWVLRHPGSDNIWPAVEKKAK